MHGQHVVGDHQVPRGDQRLEAIRDPAGQPLALGGGILAGRQPGGHRLHLGVAGIELGDDLAVPSPGDHGDRVAGGLENPRLGRHDRLHAAKHRRRGVVDEEQARQGGAHEGCSAVMPAGQWSTTTRTPPRRWSTVKSTVPSPTRRPERWRRL